LPAGSKLVVTAHYDNSANNKYNPGPEKEVHFRDVQNQSWDEMFTPFVQYTINSQGETPNTAKRSTWEKDASAARQGELGEQNALDIIEVAGCLDESPAGTWMVTHAGDAIVSKTQATTSVALKAAAAKPLGTGQYRLLGVSVFNPSHHKGQKVAVKGVLIKNANQSRLNVTSLQMVDATCVR
jgi:hypothetical protein